MVNFSHLMTCHISTHSQNVCTLHNFVDGLFLVTLEWAGTLIQGFGAHTRSKHFGETLQNSGEKINGINKSRLVNGRARVRRLISLLLKLLFNVLSDATHEKCRVNWCHGPAVDITFTLTEI